MTLPPLLTCPFCGGEPDYVYRRVHKEWFVRCTTPICRAACSLSCSYNKELKIDEAAKNADEAARRWNHNVARTQIDHPTMREV